LRNQGDFIIEKTCSLAASHNQKGRDIFRIPCQTESTLFAAYRWIRGDRRIDFGFQKKELSQ
jgi:hypothetical protein